MNQLGSASTARSRRRLTQSHLPAGALRAATSTASRHPLPSLQAVMSAPERRNMPHLHPQKLNGGLWFGIDGCIRKDIVAAYQSNFWGPWWNFGMVPQEKKDEWWTCFVQKYFWEAVHHDIVLECWKKVLQRSIGDIVSKRKKSGKKPDFIGLADWNTMLDIWEEEPHQKRSKTNSANACTNPDGLGSHRHTSGAITHSRIAYDMEIETGVKPPATEIVRKTHTRKDGTCIDKRAEALIRKAEALALEQSQASTVTEGTISEPTNEMLTAAYIEYLEVHPDEAAAAQLIRRAYGEERMTKMEDGMDWMKQGMAVLLRMNGVDPLTYLPVQRESAASAPSTRSISSQQPNQTTPTARPDNNAT